MRSVSMVKSYKVLVGNRISLGNGMLQFECDFEEA